MLFASLIRNSTTTELLFGEGFCLFAPELLFIEFEKHKTEILEKTNRRDIDFSRVMLLIQDKITVIPSNEFKEFIKEAEIISPDPDDVPYFALALKLHCGIWSNDKKLKEQNKVAVYSTEDLIRILR